MRRETPSPVDLPEEEGEDGYEPGGLGWTLAVVIIAALFLLVTNAASLRDWIDDQPPSPIQAKAAELADGWLAITEGLGLAAPREVMHSQWKRAEEARFPKSVGTDQR